MNLKRFIKKQSENSVKQVIAPEIAEIKWMHSASEEQIKDLKKEIKELRKEIQKVIRLIGALGGMYAGNRDELFELLKLIINKT